VGPAAFYPRVNYEGAATVEQYPRLRGDLLCNGCPVRAHCLAQALRKPENWGKWGGLTPKARRQLARLLADGSVEWRQVVRTFHGPQPDDDEGDADGGESQPRPA